MRAMNHTEVKALQEKIATAIEKTREQLEHCQPEKLPGWQARLWALREVAEWVGVAGAGRVAANTRRCVDGV